MGDLAQALGSIWEKMSPTPVQTAMGKKIMPDDEKRQKLIGNLGMTTASSVFGGAGGSNMAGEGGMGNLISSLINMGGSMAGAGATAASSRESRRAAEERQKALKEAYDAIIQRGQTDFGAGEQGFLQEAGQATPELQQMKQDILSGQAESLGQAGGEMQAQLARTGMRGGQASQALKRGIGQMGIQGQRDINQLIGGEAMQRAAERRAYQSAKAARGQSATYTTPTF